MASLDFKALRAKLRLIDVIRILDVRLQELHEDSPRGPCPLYCHGDNRCCRYSWPRGLWYCHRCRAGSDALGLYAMARGYTLLQAAMEACLKLGIQVPWKARSKERRTRKARVRNKPVADEGDSVIDS